MITSTSQSTDKKLYIFDNSHYVNNEQYIKTDKSAKQDHKNFRLYRKNKHKNWV